MITIKKIVTILGARPNFIKSALLSEKFKTNNINEFILHTGQHYDYQLSEAIFKDLKLKKPDINLKIGSGAAGWQTGKMLIGIEKVLITQKPNAVLIIGDTNSTLAGALASSKLGIPLIHIEAGERTFIKSMPEEINRVICDHLSGLNLCATKIALKNLKAESIVKNVYWTGDIMFDLFLRYQNKRLKPKIKLPNQFILVTIHRAENTNNIKKLNMIIDALGRLELPIVWPIHPRTKVLLKRELPSNIILILPVPYTQMLWLESNSFRIITDSGGVQKEAYWSNVPCLTIMEKTGWTQTLNGNWNQVVENPDEIIDHISTKITGKPNRQLFGDGKSASLMSRKIIKYIS